MHTDPGPRHVLTPASARLDPSTFTIDQPSQMRGHQGSQSNEDMEESLALAEVCLSEPVPLFQEHWIKRRTLAPSAPCTPIQLQVWMT